jgi:hypothetical protein
MPDIIEIVRDEVQMEEINFLNETRRLSPIAGYCCNCGDWFDMLQAVEGEYLCEECIE